MNRNTEAHFSKLPKVEIQRSLFDRSTQNKLSFNAGKLVPIFCDEYLPGDSFTMDTSIVIRTTTPFLKPVMDNLYADIFFFSVPNRLVWDHWEEFMGKNKSGPWARQTEYTIPQVTAPEGGWNIGTVADYFGIPVGVSNISISALFFRAYCLIWNEYFRDENLMNFTNVPKTDATVTGVNTDTLETDPVKGGGLLPVCKFHDYYTSALPSSQKGIAPILPITTGTAPVFGNGYGLNLVTDPEVDEYDQVDERYLINTVSDGYGRLITSHQIVDGPVVTGQETGEEMNGRPNAGMTDQDYLGQVMGVITKKQIDSKNYKLSGLEADLTNVFGPTVNQLRELIAIQRLQEKSARGGSRYIETIKAHFGVTSADARLQRPEYLGGKRIPINVDQVLQTSYTSGDDFQGNVAGWSLTADKDSSFTKSFTEHGMIIGLICVRTEKTYQQGINRMFSRKRIYDFYWSSLAHLGEVPILNKEIFAQGDEVVDDDNIPIDNKTFGFQEVWSEYRYKPSMVAGYMRSGDYGSLDIYHFADWYESKPSLGQSWIQEDMNNLDRTLFAPSVTVDQFVADIYFKYRCARPMPVYSVPGLMDHF